MTATPQEVLAELAHVRTDFASLVQDSTRQSLARPSNGTRWTNRELLFHMLFGFLITRSLRPLVKAVSRLPGPAQRSFAGMLNATAGPFDLINYWGSVIGGRLLTPARMQTWMDRVTTSLETKVSRESTLNLQRAMRFPSRWDPYFNDEMSLQEVYHYATLHYEHHRAQLTLDSQRDP